MPTTNGAKFLRLAGIKPRATWERQYEKLLNDSVVQPYLNQINSTFANALKNLPDGRLSPDILQQLDAATTGQVIDLAKTEAAVSSALNHLGAQHTMEVNRVFKQAIGVDILPVLNDTHVKDYLNGKIAENVGLIKTMEGRHKRQLIGKLQEDLITKPFDSESVKNFLEQGNKSAGYNLRRITRDQNNKIIGQLTHMRNKELEIEQYEWSTSNDTRVRDNHRSKNGEVFEWDEPPADTGHPGNDIQCRCVALPIMDKVRAQKLRDNAQKLKGPRRQLFPSKGFPGFKGISPSDAKKLDQPPIYPEQVQPQAQPLKKVPLEKKGPRTVDDIVAEGVPELSESSKWLQDYFQHEVDDVVATAKVRRAELKARLQVLTREVKKKENEFILLGDDLRDAEREFRRISKRKHLFTKERVGTDQEIKQLARKIENLKKRRRQVELEMWDTYYERETIRDNVSGNWFSSPESHIMSERYRNLYMRPKSQAARIPPIEVKISDQHQRLRTLSAAERKQVQKAVDDTVSDLSRILAKEPPWDNRKKITVEIWRDYAPPGTAHYDDSARTVRIQWQHHNKVAETDFKGILAHEITHAYENDLMYSSGKKVPFAKKFYEARWAEEGVDSARTWQQQIVRQRKMFPDSYQHQIYYDDNTELVTMGVEHFFGGYRSDLQKIRKGKWPKGWPDDIGIPPPASDDKYWAWINQTIMNRTDEEMFKHLKRQRANGTLKLAKNSDLNKRIDAWKPPAKPKLTKVTPIDTKLPGTTARRAAVKKAVAETPEFSTTLRTKIVSRLQKIKDSKFIKVLDKHLEVTRRLKLKAKVIAFNVIKNYVRDWVIEDIPVAILHGLKHRRSLRKELAGLLTRIDKLVDSEDVRLAQRRLHDISREYEQLQKVDVEALTAGGLKSYRKKVNRIKANVKKAVEPIDLEEFDSLVWRARSIERVLQSNFFTPESLAIAKRFRDMYFRKVGDKAAIPDITVDYYNGAAKWTKAQTKIVDEAIEEVMAEFQEILPLNYDWVDVDNIKINVRAEFEMLDAKNYTAPDGTINVSWRVRATPIETERFKAIIAHELGHAYEDFLRKKHGVRIGQEYKKSRVMTELGKDDLTDLNAATIQNVLGTLIPDSTLRHVYPSGSSEVTSTGVDWMWGMFRSSLDQKWPTRYVPENWNRKHRLPQILTDPESFGYVSDIILARDLKKLAVDLLERWRKRQIGKNMASNSDLITRLIAVVPPAFRTLKRQPIKKVLKKTKETVEDITAPKPPVRPKKDFTPQQKIEVVEDIVKKKVPEAEDSTKWLTNWASKEADDVVKAAHNTRKVLDDELKEAKRIVKKADESALAKEYVRLEKAEIHLKQLHQLIKTSEELDADDLKQLRRSFNNIKKNANKAARKLPVKYDEYVAKKERIAVLEKYLKDPEFNPETVELAKRFKEVYKRPKAQAAVIPENWKIEVVDDATSIAGARKWTNKEYKKVEAAIEEVKDDISRIISQDLGWAEEAGYTIKIRTGKKDALVGNDFDPNTKTIDLYWTIDGGEESVNHFKMVLAHEIGHAYENYLQDISGKNFGVEFMRDLAEKRLPQFHPLRTLSPDPKTWSNVDVEHALKPLLPDTYMGKIYRDRTTELVSMGFEMMFGSFRSNNMKTSIRAKVPKGWNKEHHVPVLLADEDYWAWFNQSVLQRTDDKLFPQIKKHFDSPRTKEVLPPTSRLKKQLDDKVPEPEPPARPPKKFDDDDSYMPQQETSAYDWKKGHADPPAYEKYVDDLLHNDIPKPTATSSALQEWVKKEIPDVMKTAAVHRAILTKRAEYLANEFLVALEPKMDIYKSIRWKGDELWRLERQIETESSMPDADELVAGLKRRRQRLKDKINELEEQLDHSYDKLTAVQHEFEFLVRYLRKDRFGSEEFITPESIELSRRFRQKYMRPKDQAAGMPRYDIQILHEPYFRSSTYERLHMWTRKDRAKLDALSRKLWMNTAELFHRIPAG